MNLTSSESAGSVNWKHSMETREHIFKIDPVRKLVQVLVFIALLAIPFFTRNPLELPPSRIVLGHLPYPTVYPFSGDTWSLSIGDVSLLHPIAFAEVILSSKVIYLPVVIAVIIPLFMTIVLGRIFCSWLCPVGFLLELNQKIHSFFKKIGIYHEIQFRDYRYFILFLSFILTFFLAFPIISVFDPPHVLSREFMYFFSHHAISLGGAGLLLGIFVIETFSTSRIWCNSICPSGGGLSLIGAKRLLNIKMDEKRCDICGQCNDVCPYYLKPMRLAEGERFDSTKCDNCGLCRDVCPNGALSYKFGR